MVSRLDERLTFDKLLAYSEPKRVARSQTVRGPALDIEAFKNSLFYFFSFKAFPSTEGKRHKGYIKFFKPTDERTQLEKVDCEVDCDCKDFRYRWAWANKQRSSSQVGTSSLNKSWDRAPRITNPTARPGLCKHLIALRNFIYGQDSKFIPTDDEGTSTRLEKLLAAANGATIGAGGQVLNQQINQRMNVRNQQRRIGQTPTNRPEPATEEPAPLPGQVSTRPNNPTNPTNPTNPRNPSNTPGRHESLVVNNVMTNDLNTIPGILAEVEQMAQPPAPVTAPGAVVPTGPAPAATEQSKGDQALAHLAGIEALLSELVALNKTDEPPAEEPMPAAEEPAPTADVPASTTRQPGTSRVPN